MTLTGLVPNQIFINMMFAMAMRHLQLLGFPKTVYNADLIGNWSNEIGQAIGVRGLQPGQSISQVAYNLQPADMSNQILTVIDRAISYTKDCMGATDAQLGNVKPDNTSAIMVLQSNAEVPLENIRAGLHEWIEDIGAILLDMMGAYYGERPVVREKELEEPVIGADGNPVIGADGRMETQKVVRRVMELFDFGVFRQLWLRVRADVGAASQFSEIATTQTLDNLRAAGVLDIVQYLERVPERLIPRKQELIEALKKQESGTAKTGGQGAEQMLGAMSGKENRCPVCGGQMTAGKWYTQQGRRYLTKAHCETDGDFYIRVRLVHEDEALRVSRLVYEPTEQVAKSYAALAQKPRARRPRRRRSARVKAKPAEPKNP